MTITTIDGVPRELLERIAQWGSVTWMDKNELRAILAKAVCGTCNTVIRPDAMQGTACECSNKAYGPPTLPQLASAAFTRAMARGATASLIMKDIQAYEPDDTPESVTISVQALEQILLQRLEDFHAAEGDALKLLKPPTDPMSATSALAHALVTDQVVGRVYHTQRQALAVLNSCGRVLPDGAPLYARPVDTYLRYVRAPSRKDPKYHEEWPEIEGGPVFDGVTYCNDLTEALKRFGVIVVETLPEGAVDE